MEKNITPDSVISALMNHAKKSDSDFPVHVFPAKIQRIILELNTTCGFPIDYTASAMLAAISVAIGNTHRIEVKRNWQESAIVYIAIVGRPGDCLSACRLRSKNSHPITFVMRPLVNADWKNNQEISCQRVQSQACLSYTECSQERSETHFLIAEQTPHGVLEQMMQRNPTLRQLVDALKLELVGIEEYNPSENSLKSE